jgi:hypothetical protein
MALELDYFLRVRYLAPDLAWWAAAWRLALAQDALAVVSDGEWGPVDASPDPSCNIRGSDPPQSHDGGR